MNLSSFNTIWSCWTYCKYSIHRQITKYPPNLYESITKAVERKILTLSLWNCCEVPCIKLLQKSSVPFSNLFGHCGWEPAWIFTAVLSATVLCVILAGLCMSSFHLGTRHRRPTLQPWDVREPPPGRKYALNTEQRGKAFFSVYSEKILWWCKLWWPI